MQWWHLWLHSLRLVRPGSDRARADDLPIQLRWSPLIAGSTTLKASVLRGTGGSNPSASATYEQHERCAEHAVGVSVVR
jgi:hypothetical protein